MNSPQTRSPLSRAVGLGSARSGAAQWWAERVSAVGLVPLTIWFVVSIIVQSRSNYAEFTDWMKEMPTTILMILLLIALFHHAALGLQVVVEDYVHSDLKFAAVAAVRLGCFAFTVAGILATLRVAWGA